MVNNSYYLLSVTMLNALPGLANGTLAAVLESIPILQMWKGRSGIAEPALCLDS